MRPAELILSLAGAYLALGAIFALWFVTIGAGRLDPAARGGTWGFRALIFPAACALWPLLLLRALRAPGERPAGHDARTEPRA